MEVCGIVLLVQGQDSSYIYIYIMYQLLCFLFSQNNFLYVAMACIGPLFAENIKIK